MGFLRTVTRYICPSDFRDLINYSSNLNRTNAQYAINVILVRFYQNRGVALTKNTPSILKNTGRRLSWGNASPDVQIDQGELISLTSYENIIEFLENSLLARNGELVLGEFVMLKGLSVEDLAKAKAGLLETFDRIVLDAVDEFESRMFP